MSDKHNKEITTPPAADQVSKEIPWGLVGLLGVVGIGGLLFLLVAANRRDTSLANKWVEFDSLSDNEKLASFAEGNNSNSVGAAAHLKMARQQLAMGLREYPSPAKDPFPPSPDSKEAKAKPTDVIEVLKQARQGFDLARKSFKDLPSLQLECMVSAARASEALEEIDDAKKRYKEVLDAKEFANSAVARDVRQRLKEMDEKGRWNNVAQIETTLRKAGP